MTNLMPSDALSGIPLGHITSISSAESVLTADSKSNRGPATTPCFFVYTCGAGLTESRGSDVQYHHDKPIPSNFYHTTLLELAHPRNGPIKKTDPAQAATSCLHRETLNCRQTVLLQLSCLPRSSSFQVGIRSANSKAPHD